MPLIVDTKFSLQRPRAAHQLYSDQWYYHRHILEQKVTPIILNIEEEANHQHQVAQADEDDHHHAAVHREPVSMPNTLSHGVPTTGSLKSDIIFYRRQVIGQGPPPRYCTDNNK